MARLRFALMHSTLLLCSMVRAEAPANTLFDVSIEELMSVPVYAVSKHPQALRDAPGIALVLTPLDWQRHGANNLLDVLRRLPGAYPLSVPQLGDNLTEVRGQRSGAQDRHVLVLINGHPYREAYYGGLDRALNVAFPLAALARIEYIRGPASALYGSNAFSAVINLVTRIDPAADQQSGSAASPAQTQLELSHGSFNSSKLGIGHGGSNGDWRWQANLQLADSDGWRFAARDVSGSAGRSDMQQQDYSGWLDVRLAGLSLQHFEDRAEFSVFGLPLLFPSADYQRRDRQTRLGFEQTLAADWQLTLNLSELQMADQQQPTDSIPYSDTRTRNRTLDASLSTTVATDWRWLAGAEYSELSATATYDDDIGARQQTRAGDRWQRLYLQGEWQPLPDWTALLGVTRSETRQIDPVSTPRAALMWEIGSGWRAKLLHGQAFRAPYLVELYNQSNNVFGNPDLSYEDITSTDLQLSWEQSQFYTSLTLFRSKIEHAIAVQPFGTDALRFVNANQLDSDGGELEGFWQPHPDWRLDFNYSLQHNHNQWGVDDVQISPNRMFKFGLWHRFSDQLDVGLWDSYFSKTIDRQTLTPGTAVVNPAASSYHHVTLALNYQLGSTDSCCRLSLFIDNAIERESVYQTDIANAGVNTLPVRAGRSVHLGFSGRY